MSFCHICYNSGWVCEEHPDKPMEHFLDVWFMKTNRRCHGAGMPCKCNTHNPPWNYPDETRIEVERTNK